MGSSLVSFNLTLQVKVRLVLKRHGPSLNCSLVSRSQPCVINAWLNLNYSDPPIKTYFNLDL